MEIIYITIPLVLVVGALVVAMFIFMAKSGQFDDLDGAAHRILLEDDVASADSQETADEPNAVQNQQVQTSSSTPEASRQNNE